MGQPILKSGLEVRTMLIVHQGALGDFILALPVLKNLKDHFPHAKVVILGYPRILELVEGHFYADQVLSIDQKGMATFFVQNGFLDYTLSEFFKRFDLVVVFGKDQGGTLLRNLKRVCQGVVLPINSFPTWEERIHLTDHLLRELSKYGFSISESFPKLYLNETDRNWGNQFWKEKGWEGRRRDSVVVVHPGSGSKKKVWPLERFVELVQTLQSHFTLHFLIVLGPAEGIEVQRTFEKIGDPPTTIVRGLSLLQLASVMEGCGLFIGNDSGISHMASALGIPTIAIFGPSDPKVWSPKGERVWVVRRELPCSPCSEERFFLCKNFECLRSIETQEVLKAVKKMGWKFQFRKEEEDGRKESR